MNDYKNLSDIFKQNKSFFTLYASLEQLNRTLGPPTIFQTVGTSNLLDTIAKSPMYENYRTLNNLSNIFKDVIPKSYFNHKNIINFVDTISPLISNSSYYKELFKSVDAVENTLGKQFNLLTQFNKLTIESDVATQLSKHRNLFQSFSDLSIKIANERVKGEISEDEYKETERVTDNLTDVAILSAPNGYITVEDLQKFEKAIFSRLDKRDLKGTISLWLSILGLLLTLLQYIPISKNGEDSADAKEVIKEIQKLNVRVNHALSQSLTSYNVKRYTNRTCKVFLKPSLHSKLLAELVAGKELAIINTNHKWALIIFLDDDGMPINGWVFKKYLKNKMPF